MYKKGDATWWIKNEEKLEKDENEAYRVLTQNYLKASREHYKQQNEKKKKRLNRLIALVGPRWYQELSSDQRQYLDKLKSAVHLDIGQGTPSRTQNLLICLGISPQFKNASVMGALKKSDEDPSTFLWELYIIIFEHDPRIPQKGYALEARFLLSSIFYLGLKNTIEEFERQTLYQPSVSEPKTIYFLNLIAIYRHIVLDIKLPSTDKKRKRCPPPKSPYLSPMMRVPKIKSTIFSKPIAKNIFLPLPDRKEFKEIIKRSSKLQTLLETNESLSTVESIPDQKIYETPHTSKKDDGVIAPRNLKLVGVQPQPLSDEVLTLSNHKDYDETGADEFLKSFDNNNGCQCAKWYPAIIDYLKHLKCESAPLPPSRTASVQSKAFPGDSYKIHYSVSLTSLQENGRPSINVGNESSIHSFENNISASLSSLFTCPAKTIIRPSILLKILLAEQAAKGNLLAQLPGVHKVPILKEWARKRIKGNYTQNEIEKITREQSKIWDFLYLQKVKVHIPKLPYSQRKLDIMNWDDRKSVNKLVTSMHQKFYKKLQRKFIQSTRLWWSSMNIEKFPNARFRDVFFAYMPSKEGVMLKTGW